MTKDADIADRLNTLEAKIARIDDHLAILQIIAAYGPAVDGCNRDSLAALWAEDGSYDFGGAPLEGREAVADLIDLDTHRAYVAQGSAHALTVPHIAIDGDRAVAINYSQVFIKDGPGWRADRTSANRWDLVRTAEGWRVAQRTNRLLDGTAPARRLLRGHRPNEVGAVDGTDA